MSAKARVKLLTPWDGPDPAWMPRFRERVAASRLVDWELVRASVRDVNALATLRLGAPCRKLTAHSQCDLRPAFGEVFSDLCRGHEWWGWCDLDVVLGDLDALLPQLLDGHDVVTADPAGIAGPFTLLRNRADVVELFRSTDDWQEVLADPDYCNFDEAGFAEPGHADVNPSLTGLLRWSGLRVRFDDRVWTDSADPLPCSNGVPSRCCELRGGKLLEIPTGRELLAYHFAKSPKRWPIPNRHRAWSGPQRKYLAGRTVVENPEPVPSLPSLPVTSAAYWDARVDAVLGAGLPLHQAVWDGPEDRWNVIQEASVRAVLSHVNPGDAVLDVGCGWGALIEALSGEVATGRWVGIDVSRRMIELARERRGPLTLWGDFSLTTLPVLPVMDGRQIEFGSDSFDWCVCRGLEGSVRVREGNVEWRRFRSEMLRVAPRALLLDYSGGAKVLKREDYAC